MKAKRILAVLLSLAMVLSSLSMTVFATAEAEFVETAEAVEAIEEVELAAAGDAELALAEALTAGGEVALTEDIHLTQMIEIPAGVTASLDLAGHNITVDYQAGSNAKHLYAFNNKGNFTITDSVGTGSVSARGIYNRDEGVLTVNNCKIVAMDNGGGACIWGYGADSEVYVNNATLIGYTGVISSEGYLEINGGTYTCYSDVDDNGNLLGSYTYNIRAYNGLKITDGTFTSRHGVIYLGGGKGEIYDGTYTIEFAAATTSNVVYLYGDADLTIYDGEFTSDNTGGKGDSGAAVVVVGSNPKLTIYDGKYVGLNGMVSGNSNTVLYGGSYSTVFDYNHYGNIESFVAPGLKVDDEGNIIADSTVAALIGDVEYATFEEAMAAVANGETVKLNKNIELEKAVSFSKDIEFTLDGNGYTISPAAGSTEANSAFNMGQGNDSTRATRKYNFTNIVFDGWTTDHVLRLQGTTSNITNCKFINTNQPDGLGIVTLTFADATVSNCVFENNVAVKAIDFNSWGDNSASVCTVEDSVFKNNTVSGPAVILYSTGSAMTVEDNEFISNTVATSGNAATVYMGFNNGIIVTGNLFKDNVVTTTHATSVRVAGGVFAGAGGSAAVITENVFEGNTASSTGYPTGLPTGVAYSAYYMPGNLDGNYWDGEEPNLDVHYSHEYNNKNSLTVENYYGSYEIDANGELVFADPRPVIAKSVALQYMLDEEASKEEGTLVYDIVVTTADDYVINRLNSADFTFALTQENGKNTYEIIDIPNDNITVNKVYNPVDGSVIEGRYEFHFDHKNNVTNDTAHAIVIAKVKLTGYGKFLFNVVEGAGTNAVHATTIVNNIVTDFTAGNGLTVNTDLDKTDDYVGVIDSEIKVSKRNLTINVSFPNAVEQNAYAYQQMKLTVSGPSYEKVIYLGNGVSVENNGDCLSMLNGGYKAQIVDELTLNTPYTITLEGEGYRAVKYTVNMTENKTLSFWNNVKDNEVYVEEGDTTGTKKYAKKVTFLAGDIVKDDEINIYDLSAVVSYFGEIDLDETNKPEYAKYDLNRDGKIDSKDVAYVLVSWGN